MAAIVTRRTVGYPPPSAAVPANRKHQEMTMGMVDVPVPEEFESEVREFLVGQTFAKAGPQWTPERLDQHLRALPAQARDLLCAVAVGVTADAAPEDAELADRFGVGRREVHGLVQEANEPTIDPFPGPILHVRQSRVAETDPALVRREVFLRPSIAAVISDWHTVHKQSGGRATDLGEVSDDARS